MPTYDYECPKCPGVQQRVVKIAERNKQFCGCDYQLTLLPVAPLFRFKGVPTKGGGPDKFTADMLGIPLKELPSGLKTEP